MRAASTAHSFFSTNRGREIKSDKPANDKLGALKQFASEQLSKFINTCLTLLSLQL